MSSDVCLLDVREEGTLTMWLTRWLEGWLKSWRRRTKLGWQSSHSRYSLSLIVKTAGAAVTNIPLWCYYYCYCLLVEYITEHARSFSRWRITCGCLSIAWLRTPPLTLRPKRTWHCSRRTLGRHVLWVRSSLNRCWFKNHQLCNPGCVIIQISAVALLLFLLGHILWNCGKYHELGEVQGSKPAQQKMLSCQTLKNQRCAKAWWCQRCRYIYFLIQSSDL